MDNIRNQLWNMQAMDINEAACIRLDNLLQRCTINLVSQLTGITRVTLTRWTDNDVSYEEMNSRDAAWFIILYETSPKIKMLLDRPPFSRPRMAKRFLDAAEEGVQNHE